eukprot:scaffold111013_cov41-Prasinocladus_malaysianus.AAC.1
MKACLYPLLLASYNLMPRAIGATRLIPETLRSLVLPCVDSSHSVEARGRKVQISKMRDALQSNNQ